MAEYTLTVFDDDDATPLFEVGTASDHAAPYLHVPEKYREASVDLLNGSAVIGQYNLRIIDPQTGATQAVRWVTSKLGSNTGHSAAMRRRALFQRVDPGTQVIIDGVVGRLQLSESFSGFHVDVKDVRDRGRRVKAFTVDGTTSIVPRGVVEGYGEIVPGSGYYLVPWTVPIEATAVETPVFGITIGRIEVPGRYVSADNPESGVPPGEIVTDAAAGVLASLELWEIWWRPDGGGTWRKIPPVGQGVTTQARHALDDDGESVQVRGIQYVQYDPTHPDAPANGEDVEFVLVHVGPATEDHPFHWEGEWGEFVALLLDGEFSDRDPRIRYDPVAVAAIKDRIRVRITEPMEIREALEGLHRAVGAAPALDDQGRLAPIRYEVPTSAAGLAVLDDDNCRALPGWEHSADSAITVVEVTYHRDIRVMVEDDVTGSDAAGDLLKEKPVTVFHKATKDVLDIMGEQTHEIDGWMFRALGGDQGHPGFGDIKDEAGAKAAERTARHAIDRFAYGGQESWLETSEPGINVGDWVLDERSWRPNYLSGERGGSTLAQVVSVRQLNEAWSAVKLVDASPYDQPLLPPTLGALSESGGVVTVPVTAIPAGAEAAVEYAVSATEPAANSGLWTFADRIDAVGNVQTPELPGNVKVWVRARSEAEGRIPSGWVSGGSIQTSTAYRLRAARVYVNNDGSVDFRWSALPTVGGVRIEYVIHPIGTDAPAYTDTVDVDAGDSPYSLPAGTVEAGYAITADLTPYQGFSGGAVTGAPGTAVTVTDSFGDGEAIAPAIERIYTKNQTETHITKGILVNGLTSEVWIYPVQVPQDTTDALTVNDKDEIVNADGDLVESIPRPVVDGEATYTTPLPPPDQVIYAFAEPRDSNLDPGELWDIDIHPVDRDIAVHPIPRQEGSTGILRLEINDPRLVLTSLEFRKREGTDEYGEAWLDSWDLISGTIGIDETLVREEAISLAAKHTGSIEWRGTFIDEDGVTRPIGGEHTFDLDRIAEILGGVPSFGETGDVGFTGLADEDGRKIYVTVGVGVVPPDPTAAANDGEIPARYGFVDTGVHVPLGQEAWIKAVAEDENGDLGPVLDPPIRIRRGVAGKLPFRWGYEPLQVGSTGTLESTFEDPTLSITSIAFQKREGSGLFGGTWLTAWDSETGTAGVDEALFRSESIGLAAKHTGEIKVRVQYVNEDGEPDELYFGHPFDADTIAEVAGGFISFGPTGQIVVTGMADEDGSGLYVTARAGSEPPDPTAAAHDAEIAARFGAQSTGIACAQGQVAFVRVAAYDSEGNLGPVAKLQQRRGIGEHLPFGYGYEPKQVGSTGVLYVDIYDPTFAVTAVKFQKREGTTAFGGTWLTSWDSATGTVGVDEALARSESVGLASKHTGEIKVLVEYVDEDGNAHVAGSITFPPLIFGHTFDLDTEAQITEISPGIRNTGELFAGVIGDEDTAHRYIRVTTDGSTPADPTNLSNDGAQAGRSGRIYSGMSAANGDVVTVKAVGYNAAGEPGPVQSVTWDVSHDPGSEKNPGLLYRIGLAVVDDDLGSGDDEYTMVWTAGSRVTSAYDLEIRWFKDDTVVGTSSGIDPSAVSSASFDDTGAADGVSDPHSADFVLKDGSGNVVQSQTIYRMSKVFS